MGVSAAVSRAGGLSVASSALLGIRRKFVGRDGSFGGIFSTFGRCTAKPASKGEDAPGQLSSIQAIVPDEQGIIPPRDNEFGYVHCLWSRCEYWRSSNSSAATLR
jgi:hypothetical protein